MATRRTFLVQAAATAAAASTAKARPQKGPVKIAIVGLVHDHVRGFLPTVVGNPEVELCGVVEPNAALFQHYADQYHLKPSLRFDSLDRLLATNKVEALAAFTSTLDHRAVAETAAAHRVHLMMEKPMATSLADARAMAAAARKGGIELIVNYETSFWPSIRSAIPYVTQQHAIGDVRKVVWRAGHSGPKAICSPEFLAWLTDPLANGGGALMDFGCYGADLAACLLPGVRPVAVSAVTQSFQPKVYPKVEDEANLVITYPEAVLIVEASWNWARGQKELDIYGTDAELHLPDRDTLTFRQGTVTRSLPIEQTTETPLAHLLAVTHGTVKPSNLAALETNLLVIEVLEAAKESARTQRQVTLSS